MEPIKANVDGWHLRNSADISIDEFHRSLTNVEADMGLELRRDQLLIDLARAAWFWMAEACNPRRRKALETYGIIRGLDACTLEHKIAVYLDFAADTLSTLSAFIRKEGFYKFSREDILVFYKWVLDFHKKKNSTGKDVRSKVLLVIFSALKDAEPCSAPQ